MPKDLLKQRVAVVGGGLAGLAAAVALSETGLDVQLFEARRQLGGRAGSFYDQVTDTTVDHCQHVSMRCCTNFADFCRRTGIGDLFQRYSTLHFFGPAGRKFDLQASRWLPAPFHLGPSFLRMGFLSFRERIGVGHALLKLARLPSGDGADRQTIGEWLHLQAQSGNAVRRFWNVVLVSALGETLDRSSLAAARKVFVDGFMANRRAYHVEVPTVPLAELYGRVAGWLSERGVNVHMSRRVESVKFDDGKAHQLSFSTAPPYEFDQVILAVTWRQLQTMMPGSELPNVVQPAWLEQLGSSPITAVHLWFDRQITDLPHAVIVDRLSQWVFNHGVHQLPEANGNACHAYQVVISASESLSSRDKEDIRDEVLADLGAIWPVAAQAKLVRWQTVTQRHAVFSYTPGLDSRRPPQRTSCPNLFLAGDWTSTSWPSTMEGAVRSGYLAAEQVLSSLGRARQLLVDDLPRSHLARLLIRD